MERVSRRLFLKGIALSIAAEAAAGDALNDGNFPAELVKEKGRLNAIYATKESLEYFGAITFDLVNTKQAIMLELFRNGTFLTTIPARPLYSDVEMDAMLIRLLSKAPSNTK